MSAGTYAARVVENMRTLRKARGWTAQKLAEEMTRAGVPWDRQVVSKLENGWRRTVTVDELAALAVVLGVTSPWSLTGPVAVRYDVVITEAPDHSAVGGKPEGRQ